MKRLVNLSLLAYTALSANAFAFGIDRLLADIDASKGFKGVATFTVFNDTSDNTIFTTAKAFTWTMDERGESHLEPTKDIQVLPSVQRIGTGESAPFKVRYNAAPPSGEKTYRILFEEVRLPSGEARKDGDVTVTSETVSTGMTAGLAMSVPVYVSDYASKVDSLDLVSAALREEDGKTFLEVDNPRNRRITLSSHSLNGKAGGGLGVVLASQKRLLPLPTDEKVREMELTVSHAGKSRTLSVSGAHR